MSVFLIGDVQGCDEALRRLLDTVAFSPSRDTLYLLGDLVNRGPDSLGVLRRLRAFGGAARCLLGNHDLHLLAVAHGVRRPGRRDTLDAVLGSPERFALLDWLRHQHMALHEHGVLMVHAGVLPSWDVVQTLALAAELEAVLQGPDLGTFLQQMYGDEPAQWSNTLTGAARLRVVVNALTRLRFCTPEGRMELFSSGGADSTPPGHLPWFDVPGRRTAGQCVAFGHWSTLGWLANRPDLLALDTGCVWGGCLSALRLATEAGARHELIQVECAQAQRPGQ